MGDKSLDRRRLRRTNLQSTFRNASAFIQRVRHGQEAVLLRRNQEIRKAALASWAVGATQTCTISLTTTTTDYEIEDIQVKIKRFPRINLTSNGLRGNPCDFRPRV